MDKVHSFKHNREMKLKRGKFFTYHSMRVGIVSQKMQMNISFLFMADSKLETQYLSSVYILNK